MREEGKFRFKEDANASDTNRRCESRMESEEELCLRMFHLVVACRYRYLLGKA